MNFFEIDQRLREIAWGDKGGNFVPEKPSFRKSQANLEKLQGKEPEDVKLVDPMTPEELGADIRSRLMSNLGYLIDVLDFKGGGSPEEVQELLRQINLTGRAYVAHLQQ